MPSINDEYREVIFDTYCPKCKYRLYPEESDICTECLAEPMNQESQKPVNFKEAKVPEKYNKTYNDSEKKYMKAIENIFDI